MSGISEHNWVIEAAMARDDFAGTFAGVVVRRLNNLISTHDSDITWEKEAALEMARAVQLIERLHSGDDAQAAQVPQVPSAAQIEAAWHAFENCPIDLVGDSDEEQKKCVIAAVKAALAAQPPAAPVETKPFYGAQCPTYPNCSGGCGLGCTHEVKQHQSCSAGSASEPRIETGRCYYEKRVGWHWEVWFCHSDSSPDPNSGATEWKASAVKYWRWINAARAANDAWCAFNDGVWIANCRHWDAENHRRELA